MSPSMSVDGNKSPYFGTIESESTSSNQDVLREVNRIGRHQELSSLKKSDEVSIDTIVVRHQDDEGVISELVGELLEKIVPKEFQNPIPEDAMSSEVILIIEDRQDFDAIPEDEPKESYDIDPQLQPHA